MATGVPVRSTRRTISRQRCLNSVTEMSISASLHGHFAACILALALGVFAAASNAAERVVGFHSDIRIAPDASLTVTETIEVQAEGKEIRRGILRDFPTEYRDRLGNRVSVPLDVLKVTRNGQPEPFALERLSNGTRIRIGEANRMLGRGKHVYAITYRTARQIGFFDRHDELYWNVNGSGWSFAFDRLTAEVTLPQKVPAGELKVEAYTGPQGARGRDYNAFVRHGSAAFRATRELEPGEGLTIVVAFPKGVVAQPSSAVRATWFLKENLGIAAGIAGVVALLAFLAWRWWLVGRDPRAGPRFPRYEAPPGIGPAGARYIDRMAFDERCFAAALLGLGSRGFLRIRQFGERYRVERTGSAVEWLPGEQELARRLLPDEDARVDIEKQHNPKIEEARAKFAAALEHHFGKKLFSKSRGSLYGGIALAIITSLLIAGLETPPSLVGGLVMFMLLILFASSFWLPAYSVQGRRLQDAIEGLRQYLGVAEADDLARMKAPPQTKEEFAKFLPYAVALGVERTWADRFAATLGAAAVAAAVADYYSNSSSDGGSGDGLVDSLSDLGGTIASAATPPGSDSGSSDSGGGSSGGGGGGGGGSGW
jgi:uncharacterized membrane protein YgcG